MAQRKYYDCIVIGGGHNGLVAAAYLARGASRSACWSGGPCWGGCATTEELWPGYQVSTAAYVVSLLSPEIIRELHLRQYGLTILPRNPSSYTPLLEGRSLLMGPEMGPTCQQIAQFSRKDAEAYPQYTAQLNVWPRCWNQFSRTARRICCRCPRLAQTGRGQAVAGHRQDLGGLSGAVPVGGGTARSHRVHDRAARRSWNGGSTPRCCGPPWRPTRSSAPSRRRPRRARRMCCATT